MDTFGCAESSQLVLLPWRMTLHLVNSRRNTSNFQQICQLLGGKIAYAYSPSLARVKECFHCLPCVRHVSLHKIFRIEALCSFFHWSWPVDLKRQNRVFNWVYHQYQCTEFWKNKNLKQTSHTVERKKG